MGTHLLTIINTFVHTHTDTHTHKYISLKKSSVSGIYTEVRGFNTDTRIDEVDDKIDQFRKTVLFTGIVNVRLP